MANVDPNEERPIEATEELEGGAAAAAAYGQPGLALAGGIGSLATGAAAHELSEDADAASSEYPRGETVDRAGSGDDFAGEGDPEPDPRSDDRGMDAGPAMQNQG
jgi:hypothetical protein